MNKSKKTNQSRSVKERTRFLRLHVFALALLGVGGVTAIAHYELRGPGGPPAGKLAVAKPAPGKNMVTVAVGNKKLLVNAQTLQQGPLTQEQAQQMADALKDNQSTDGLVQVQHADGTVSVDLQGRFQNVTLARKNDDGSVSQACVDNSQAAGAFLNDSVKETDPGRPKKAVLKEQ
jgi:hypothetical protein